MFGNASSNGSQSIPPSNWAIVGRWTIGLLTSGQLMVHDLELRPNRRNELGVGWFVHYGIAIVYAAIFMLLMRANILAAEFTDGLLFGVVSVVVPWLFFLPCLGKGIMGRLTPNPPLVCALALMMHSIFGVAIGLGFYFFCSVIVSKHGVFTQCACQLCGRVSW